MYQIRKELDKPRADGFLGNTALTLDYPNADDKSVGRTGYGIWIHGVPSNVHVRCLGPQMAASLWQIQI